MLAVPPNENAGVVWFEVEMPVFVVTISVKVLLEPNTGAAAVQAGTVDPKTNFDDAGALVTAVLVTVVAAMVGFVVAPNENIDVVLGTPNETGAVVVADCVAGLLNLNATGAEAAADV